MWIKNRIDTEYKKHKDLDWSRLAEAKILSTLNDKVEKLKEEISKIDNSNTRYSIIAIEKIDKIMGFCTTKVSIKDTPSQQDKKEDFVPLKQDNYSPRSENTNSVSRGAIPAEDTYFKELEIARRCLNFKGCYCENKDCLNEACSLNEKYNPREVGSALSDTSSNRTKLEENRSSVNSRTNPQRLNAVQSDDTETEDIHSSLDRFDNHSPRENKEFKSLRAEIGIKPEDTHAKDNYMLFAPNDEPIAKTNDIVKDKKGCGKFLGWLKGNIKLVCGEYDVLCPKCEERIESPDYPESQEEWEECEKLVTNCPLNKEVGK